jgi:3'-phosphoadenosine 5'-phosphosulfate sulfotransferase (PAPS reductase)/FAD synthetase
VRRSRWGEPLEVGGLQVPSYVQSIRDMGGSAEEMYRILSAAAHGTLFGLMWRGQAIDATAAPHGRHPILFVAQERDVNPIANWTQRDVWTYLKENGIPHNPLYDLGFASIGCAPCTRVIFAGEDERAGRWSGTGKIECGIQAPEAAAAAGSNAVVADAVDLVSLDDEPVTRR